MYFYILRRRTALSGGMVLTRDTCGEQDTAILGLTHPVNSNGSAGEVAGEFFQPAAARPPKRAAP